MSDTTHTPSLAFVKPYIQLIVWIIIATGWAFTVRSMAENNARRIEIVEKRMITADEVRYQLQESLAKQSKDIEYMRQSVDRIEKKLDRR